MPREPESFEGAVARSIETWLHRYMPAVADALGPLPDTVQPTTREKLARWTLRSEQAPPGETTAALADEALRTIVEEHERAGRPLPDGRALTGLVAAKVNSVLYPYRQEVYGRGRPRPQDRVREAERYARLAAKASAEPPAPAAAPDGGSASAAAPLPPLPTGALASPEQQAAPDVRPLAAPAEGEPLAALTAPPPQPQGGGF